VTERGATGVPVYQEYMNPILDVQFLMTPRSPIEAK
jgi:hypothetical protein